MNSKSTFIHMYTDTCTEYLKNTVFQLEIIRRLREKMISILTYRFEITKLENCIAI